MSLSKCRAGRGVSRWSGDGRGRRWGWWLAGALLPVVLGAAGARAETPPRPVARVPLSDLGFPGYVVSFMHAGASMTTVHVLDESHVLFTYSLRALVPRIAGDDATDSDRQVAALLVELPSGKVMARTMWRLHDHGRYLWEVGPGTFVLRSGSSLSLLAPLRQLAAGQEAFQRVALPHRPGQPVLVDGSPDGAVLTVELMNEVEVPASEGDEPGEARKRKHYTLEFFRISGGSQGQPMGIAPAGAIGSPMLLRLAMDGDGYLWAEDGERGRWMMTFNEFGGKQEKLAPIMSSCHPRMNLLSRSQFLVETCRGSDEQPMLASYGFDGHENWQEPLNEALQPPTLALAPAAGRFALSRVVASAEGASVSGMVQSDTIAQEVRVYQTESGDMVFHLHLAPASRAAENFDLSADGRTLVTLGPQTMDVYRLPELTAKDRKELAEAQMMTPPVGSGPVALTRITRPLATQQSFAGGDAVHKADEPRQPPAPAVSAAAAKGDMPAAEPAPEPGSTDGERTPARKAPTLLNPGEKAEYKGQSGAPQ